MAKTTKNKFVIIDPSQTTEFSHNYQYNRIIARQAREAGFDVTLMTHKDDKSAFDDLGVRVERAFPHSLYDYDGTHDYWRSVFWRKAFHARRRLENLYGNIGNFGYFKTFPDALTATQYIVRILLVLFSPLIYILNFVQNRLVYKRPPYHRDQFAEIIAAKFRGLALTKGDQVIMHSATFGALEAFMSIRALSALKEPYGADFTAIFHHSLDEAYANQYWYMEYYQRSELNSLKRRWEIASPFANSRFLALTPQLVTHLSEASRLPFGHFHHICDGANFTAADDVPFVEQSNSVCKVGIRTEDVTSSNLETLVSAIKACARQTPEIKISFLNRGQVVTKTEALKLGAAIGGFAVIDTTTPIQFLAAFIELDALILPYLPSEYKHRVSAVLYEASAFGLPVIVPAETTLSSQAGLLKVYAYEGDLQLSEKLSFVAAHFRQERTIRKEGSQGQVVRQRLVRNMVQADLLEQSQGVSVTAYGPVAAIVSPFWGRCGSTTVFDSETEYLIDKGYYLARTMVIQWRVLGNSTHYIFDVLRENVNRVRPHVFLIASPRRRDLILMRLSKTFRRKSALGQDVMRLGRVKEHDAILSSYFFNEADVAVVNHSFHGDYAKRFRKAKVILETQDIQSLQYKIRNEVNRATGRVEGVDQWMQDEADVWRGVDACVNLSPDEQITIQQYQPNSHLILPLVDEKQAVSDRSWVQYCADNGMHESVGHIKSFDFLLWGDFHPANISSTRWFIDHVIIPETIPNSIALVVGRVGHQIYGIFGSRQNLWCAGFVDKLDDAVLRSKILVLPDQAGSGISIKTMDALALQRPFVATTLALRSLNLGDGRFKGCDTLEEFVADCKLLLKSDKARKERVKVAKYLYDLNFSRNLYYQKWDGVLRSVGIEPGQASH